MNYKIWNKTDSINGVEAQVILNKSPFNKTSGDIILIYENEQQILAIESKDVLAEVYGINKEQALADFMEEYFIKSQPTINEQEIEEREQMNALIKGE